ncbi:uncharacterized protein RAG0_13367 [Rhynchosporium agropyri]|uniref:PH domain-containing protein n=1 Tax=Rhynchosporium agropyri TaxID=914238 RepID=A0A1E1LES4_9HELO|nr:uncharacterized protein RAG0_13367 [Rhynchosporium agropyri]
MANLNGLTPIEAGGLDELPRQDINLAANRRERPPMMNLSTGDIASRVPLRAPKIQKKDSKGGLRAMFTRKKTEQAIAISPLAEEDAPMSGFSERSMGAAAEASLLSVKMAKQRTEKSTPVREIPISETPGKSTKTSRMNMSLRSRSAPSVKTPSKVVPDLPSTKSMSRPRTRSSAAWDPPPLFQAYPQAIKHAQLSASTLSADSIIRMNNHRRNNSLRSDTEATDCSTAGEKKAEKSKSRHKRQVSGSLLKADWIQKTFVLVTSGYLLQYAGEGSFDRLPEKIMQLGKDSVAFASDAIPGKHWVLQISQAMDSDGTPASDSRSLLSRLAFRGADYRRSATSLLLVFDSAEDMDSWLAIVRREIEALGGKKHASETGRPKADDKILQLKSQPSHRYLIHRSTDDLSNLASPQMPSLGPPPWIQDKDNEPQKNLEQTTSERTRSQGSSIRPSTGHSMAGSVTSNDARQLESLRDSTNRFSYLSSGQRTLITSRGSSSSTSSTRESASFDDNVSKPSSGDIHSRPNAAAVSERRRSMLTMAIPLFGAPITAKAHRHSTYGGPSSVGRSRSPGFTPNFSVPNSSIKRYSIVRRPSSPIASPSSRPVARDSLMKGTRKAPPSALHVPRSLSPVKASPKKAAAPMASTSSSPNSRIYPQHQAQTYLQAKPSVITIPPRSPSDKTPTMSISHPRRMSSLAPLAPHESAHLDLHLPRRYSSMQTLGEVGEKRFLNNLDAPSRPAPLLPAELASPISLSPLRQGFDFSPPSENQQIQPQTQQMDFAQKQYSRPSSRTSINSRQPLPLSLPLQTPMPLPALANMKSKVNRPISMQISPAASHRNNHYLTHNQDQTTIPPNTAFQPQPRSVIQFSPRPTSSSSIRSSSLSPTTSISTAMTTPMSIISPGLQRAKGEPSKTLGIRKSMPMLVVNGPPPAPPPRCALPPIPPQGGSDDGSGSGRARSGSVRASVSVGG